jgi:hypothetical protein
MKKDDALAETVTFRVSKKTYDKLEEQAAKEKKSVNEWCRDLTTESVNREYGLSPGLQVMLAELYSLRKLLEDSFDLASRSELNEENFLEVLLNNTQDRQSILKRYFSKKNILESDGELETFAADTSLIKTSSSDKNDFNSDNSEIPVSSETYSLERSSSDKSLVPAKSAMLPFENVANGESVH